MHIVGMSIVWVLWVWSRCSQLLLLC